MPVIERKRLSFSISLPESALLSLKTLAEKREMSVPRYVKHLIEKDIIEHNLPLYWSGNTEEN
ncbi:MAG: hypothetical protein IKC03_09590 [Oscillospiraceae bacterium]|nr:hypothetical protein [Oscillospiraceae bacterium]